MRIPVEWLRRFHLTMVFVWAGLALPGLTIWREAIWFVVLMSLYANLAAEFAAYQGARAEEGKEGETEVKVTISEPMRAVLLNAQQNEGEVVASYPTGQMRFIVEGLLRRRLVEREGEKLVLTQDGWNYR